MAVRALTEWRCDGCANRQFVAVEAGFPAGWMSAEFFAHAVGRVAVQVCPTCAAPARRGRVLRVILEALDAGEQRVAAERAS
jgi:hypothetical protein